MLRRRTYLGARASTSMEQEHSWAIRGKVEVMGMLRMSCKIGLRCFNAYLGWRKLPAAIGQLGLEGPEANLRNWRWRANTTWGKENSSGNQLSEHAWRLYIELPEDLQCGAISGGGSVLRDSKQIYFFRSVEQFSEKLEKGLYSMATNYRRL